MLIDLLVNDVLERVNFKDICTQSSANKSQHISEIVSLIQSIQPDINDSSLNFK